MSKLYLDSETCGLHGMPVLFQYAVEDGPIVLYDIWKEPIGKTLDLIEWFCEHTIVGFNLAFDFFHLVKTYTVFRLCPRDWIPEEHIDEMAVLEPEAQDGPCLKPASALDLMLHSRKGPYQSLMAREDVRIRKVPTVLAYALAEELEKRIELDNIYFARSYDRDAPRWGVYDRKNKDGEIDDQFKDVVLRFNPAGGLKYLAEHAMGFEPKYHYTDVEPDTKHRPIELGYAPTALAISTPEEEWKVFGLNKRGDTVLKGYAWPGVIHHFIEHWANREDARDYANDDIVYTRALDQHFGYPEPGDDDSVLACMVPVIRWRGFRIDIDGMKALLAKAQDVVANAPVNINKPSDVRAYIAECMDDTEKSILEDSTRKAKLIAVGNWQVYEDELEDATEDAELHTYDDWHIVEEETCGKCGGEGCNRCGGTGSLKPGKHPAAARAEELLAVKAAAKEVELYTKLIHAGKFHASFKVIGTLSTRMSGADGLNPQGIKHAKEVRRMFPLAWDGYVLGGGDFDSFEVTLADAVYDDPALRQVLISGQKIHAYFGMEMYPGVTYEEVLASDGTDNDMYTKGKSGVFGMIYGGDFRTLVRNFGISVEVARRAEEGFFRRFPGIPKARQKTFDAFCSMRQPEGIGGAVIWRDPADYIESFLGFRRYFTLENKITAAIFALARKPPKHWREFNLKVVRRDRVQVAHGAVASALYAAAFAIQAGNMRAASNHEIQSPGGQITKYVQRRIWDLQPVGVHELLVAPMNIHDEIMCVSRPSLSDAIANAVRESVEHFRPQVPLIGMTWFKKMESWAGKKGGEVEGQIKIQAPEMATAA